MQILAHAGAGWLLAMVGGGSRRFRQAVLLSAVLPDLDGLAMLGGLHAFGIYHDRITHGLPFSVLVSLMAVVVCKGERWRTLLFTQAGFYSHYFGDYFLSGWPLGYWFPFSHATYSYAGALCLSSSVNYVLCLLAILYFGFTGWRFHRTPFEVFSVRLDDRVCKLLFRPKTMKCSSCARLTNETCADCGEPVCARHAPLDCSFVPRCAKCGRVR